MSDQDRRRDDEPTAEIAVSPKSNARIRSSEEMEVGAGRRIASLIPYQLLSFRLRGRKDDCWLIVLDTEKVSRIVVAYAFRTSDFVTGRLQEVSFTLNGMQLSYAPALRESFARDFLQKSGDFFSPDPPLVMKPSSMKRWTSAIDVEESSTIPPPDKSPLVKESGNIWGILSMREAKFLEAQRKSFTER